MWFFVLLLLFFLFWIMFPIIGAGMARRRHRDAALWALICFFLPLVGILMLAIAGDAHDERGEASAGRKNSNEKWIRWQALIDVDPDIRAAASRVRAFGSHYEEQLAEKYLALNDKKFLPTLVAKTLEDAGYAESATDPEPDRRPLERPAKPAPAALDKGADAPHTPPQQTQAISPPAPAPSARAHTPVGPQQVRQAENLRRVAPSGPRQTTAGAVQGKIRTSVYQQNGDGSFEIIKGKHVGKRFGSYEEMRRTLR